MRHKGDLLTFVLFMAPGVLLLIVFTYWPIAYTFYLSFHRWSLPAPEPTFVALENYARIASDPWFWRVLLNSIVYALAVVLIAQSLAFGLALLMNRRTFARPLFRTVAFAPVVATGAAAALAWVLVLHPQSGPLSVLYAALGIEGPHWLESTRLALPAIILVGIWKEVGFATLFFLAGLQDLPKEPYEAAHIDGASGWRRLTSITLPFMSPVIFYLSLSGFIAAVKIFDTVAIMTEGGPVYPASSTFVYHLYQTGFRDYRFGEASTIAVVFFALMLGLTYAQLRGARRWVFTDA